MSIYLLDPTIIFADHSPCDGATVIRTCPLSYYCSEKNSKVYAENVEVLNHSTLCNTRLLGNFMKQHGLILTASSLVEAERAGNRWVEVMKSEWKLADGKVNSLNKSRPRQLPERPFDEDPDLYMDPSKFCPGMHDFIQCGISIETYLKAMLGTQCITVSHSA